MTAARGRLRALAELLQPGEGLIVSREALLEALGASERADPAAEALEIDLTVEALARLFERRPSTARGWLEAGRFPEAYKSGKRWRIPREAVERFQQRQRESGQQAMGGRAAHATGSLGDWRQHIPKRTT